MSLEADEKNVEQLCRKQEEWAELCSVGTLPMQLRQLTSQEREKWRKDFVVVNDQVPRWEIDLPTLGVTVCGHTVKGVFKQARKQVIREARERSEEEGP